MFNAVKNAFLYAKDFCEDTAENIKETVITAVDGAKLHYRIVSKRNELNNLYCGLGRKLFVKTEGQDDSEREKEINALCERIPKKEKLLNGLLEEYRIVTGKVICPACGKFTSERYAYCPYCGTKINDSIEETESDVDEETLFEIRETDEI